MSFVKMKDFVRLAQDGTIERLYCKLCGTIIGEVQHQTIGFRERPDGRLVERILEGFYRNHMYMEVKISFEDGSAHVTNGCKKCLMGDLSVEQLDELTQTDEEEQGLSISGRKSRAIVEQKFGGGIL